MQLPKQEQEQDANPFKRKFTDINNNNINPSPDQMVLDGPDHPTQKISPSPSPSPSSINPRGFQLRAYEVAVKRNTIALLETGTGKTMIAIMLIRDIGQTVKCSGKKNLIVFLAPTVHLVNQQYKQIKLHTNLEVEEYYGGKGVDEWTLKRWEKEINEHDVLVMTPQVFLDALRKAFLNLGTVCLLVFDECHHATGNHPYAKIMKEFYHESNNKPKIFGMTASPIVRKGVSSTSDCEDQISELESLLDSQIFTIEDRAELEMFAPTAKEIPRFYDPSPFSGSELKEKMQTSFSKFDASLMRLQESIEKGFEDMEDKFKTMQKRLSNDLAKILHCLDDLGLICAYEALKICIENLSETKEEFQIYREILVLHQNFLEELLYLVGESLQPESKNLIDSGYDFSVAENSGHVSPKLHRLLQLFHSFQGEKQITCIIFVERIITAKAIERFMKKVTSLAHLTVSYLTGSKTSVDALAPKMQKETLESFRSGKVNLLFATDVVEEGIDIPNCSYVVRFDLPKTVRSYVQSRGRARQSDSEYVLLLERGNLKQRDQLFDLLRSEFSMRDAALTRDPAASISKSCVLAGTSYYRVDVTGASVTADLSASLIRRYCEKLPNDEYCTPKLKFEFSFPEDSCICTLTLPGSAAIQKVVGPPCTNHQLAKQLACLEACKKLHQAGALDDHLMPRAGKATLDKEASVKRKTLDSDAVAGASAGSTKRKELHGTSRIQALSGTWGEKHDGAVFHAYRFHFSCNVVEELYSGFVLLVESRLDDDVGNVEVDLYLIGKTVKASVSWCGQVHLNAEEMKKARRFQEFFFNGLYGRLFVKSKSAEKKREFLLQNETESLWSPSYMYLLLPLDSSDSAGHESLRINWTAIDSCVSVVDFLNKNSLLDNIQTNNDSLCGSSSCVSVSEGACREANLIYFANGSFDNSNLKEMVVIAIHSGKIYSIVEALDDLSAESPFEENADESKSKSKTKSNFTSYADYFNKQYGIVLKYPKQPLMRLKQSHNPHNLLVNFSDEGDSAGRVIEKTQFHVRMPPELLISIDIPRTVVKSCYLLPSLMHRLETLMLASQLRKEINCYVNSLSIPSSLILEALTTLRCCETFSMERLELLGDSVLKYVLSCELYLKNPNKHEGHLSSQRQRAVRNSTLYQLGIDRKLQGYIRDGAFDPRRWVAPAQITLHPTPCKCGVDTREVPFDPKFHDENPSIKVGISCDMGHRWMGSKTISDCVEALIGAYYVSGGLDAAVHMMKWLGIDAELEPKLVFDAISSASLRSYLPKNAELDELETKLGYKFSVRFFLQEAIMHQSVHEVYCYERLEFLGDSVLDILITWHLYQSHTEIDPGELTDLRAACVNNENFAQVAVRKKLYKHLQYCSPVLEKEIKQYLKSFTGSDDTNVSAPTTQGPKALGDLVESIAGAILIDTKLNLDEVWRIFKPLLSPLVTPDKLQLPPFRELTELCDFLGYFMKEKCVNKGEKVHVELRLQLDDELLIGEGSERTRKLARGKAASCLLKHLEKRNICRGSSKKNKQVENLNASCSVDSSINGLDQTIDEGLLGPKNCKKRKTDEDGMLADSTRVLNGDNDCNKKSGGISHETPIIGPIDMKKGGPRTCLFELCKKQQWPMPKFETTEVKSRTPIEFGEGSERRTGFSSFVSSITLRLPKCESIECFGEARADKKSSFDSAALVMLHELQKRGELVIDKSQ